MLIWLNKWDIGCKFCWQSRVGRRVGKATCPTKPMGRSRKHAHGSYLLYFRVLLYTAFLSNLSSKISPSSSDEPSIFIALGSPLFSLYRLPLSPQASLLQYTALGLMWWGRNDSEKERDEYDEYSVVPWDDEEEDEDEGTNIRAVSVFEHPDNML